MQSAYTKENLYDLDSDDDELDFLRKDVDHADRARDKAQQKAEASAKARAVLGKAYERDYPVQYFEQKYPHLREEMEREKADKEYEVAEELKRIVGALEKNGLAALEAMSEKQLQMLHNELDDKRGAKRPAKLGA